MNIHKVSQNIGMMCAPKWFKSVTKDNLYDKASFSEYSTFQSRVNAFTTHISVPLGQWQRTGTSAGALGGGAGGVKGSWRRGESPPAQPERPYRANSLPQVDSC